MYLQTPYFMTLPFSSSRMQTLAGKAETILIRAIYACVYTDLHFHRGTD